MSATATGCPREFGSDPTLDTREATMGWIIREGYYGETRLDGLCGVTDEQVDAIRRLDITPLGFSGKEQALFELAIKVNGEAHSVTLEDWDHLRDDLGATDEEIVETLERVNFGNSVNLTTGATGGGKEEWCTYNMEDFEAEEAPEAAE